MPDYSGLLAALNTQGPSVQPMNVTDQGTGAPNPVPTFTPPANPAVPIHHSFLSRIGAALSNGVSPVPSSMQGLLSPEDLHHARSAGFLALGNSLLNPTLDARGFKQSTLGSIASGLQSGQQASAQSMGGALQASQYATGIAQQKRLTEGRQMAAQQFAIGPNDTPEVQLRKLTAHSQYLTSIGDDAGAKAIDSAAAAMNHERGIYTTGAAAVKPVDWEVKNNGKQDYLFDKTTGRAINFDGTPFTDHMRHLSDDEKAHQGVVVQMGQDRMDQAQRNHDDRADQFAANKFWTDTADLRKENMQANQFLALADQVKNNPEAYKSVVINYMGALDPKAQVRSKMLEYASKIDPSWDGQWSTLIDRIKSGKFPVNQLQGMVENVRATHAMAQKQYEAKYNETVGRRAGVKQYIANSSAEFALPGDAPAPQAPAAGGAPPANPFR